ncbi:isopentenyl-diphosphate Delta-isomerase [Nocardia sp. CDC186]|uniref:Isopentenyl-diphosphate Delta-isomerase n=1 Tax=Nocardia implantans TaxID=3108168 RepID=A0ABU6B1Q8_9NOCA|nr:MULTISPECIES: isopentenyl-diphosphate Delta-isomerase [unclassified Nocardia]MBF6195768.1 isopentenyl-diphosphate Delta-isomerase [Nocardia beijingensis]MEA3531146.1 isopentenyl-diphosphate Delta-isomerase [Nocardia sp. CDC192]MEB3513644.1 isopentenyl-diphosphate Delta-isomerase [Nocardia sp. CDC186]
MTDTLAQPYTDREALPVELVDDAGRAVGACTVAEAHLAPGRLHRAFSVLLFDSAGRVLLQQRAAVKTRFPSLWANTCCGHPAPSEPVATAAGLRLAEEMGLTIALTEAGIYRYHAADLRTGRVESEWDHVLIGQLDIGAPRPDPAEVADFAWIQPDALRDALADNPEAYTPWLAGVLDVAERAHVTGTSAD